MAGLDGTITFTADLRPCYADGKKALFHKFVEHSRIVEPSPMIGGHNGGVIKYTLAIVEYDNGKVEYVEPCKICFADNKINEYAF